MDCACIKGYYDAFIYQLTDNEFIYIDASEWMEGERYKGEKIYDLNIKGLSEGFEFDVTIEGRLGQVVKSENIFSGIYLLNVINCETSYFKYGVSLFDIQKVYDALVLEHSHDMKEDIIELMLRMERLRLKVNQFETEQDATELIEDYEDLKLFVEQLKCKL